MMTCDEIVSIGECCAVSQKKRFGNWKFFKNFGKDSQKNPDASNLEPVLPM